MSEDFVSTPNGVTLLDAISMRLQVIGESVKKIRVIRVIRAKKNSGVVATSPYYGT